MLWPWGEKRTRKSKRWNLTVFNHVHHVRRKVALPTHWHVGHSHLGDLTTTVVHDHMFSEEQHSGLTSNLPTTIDVHFAERPFAPAPRAAMSDLSYSLSNASYSSESEPLFLYPVPRCRLEGAYVTRSPPFSISGSPPSSSSSDFPPRTPRFCRLPCLSPLLPSQGDHGGLAAWCVDFISSFYPLYLYFYSFPPLIRCHM